jgi:hypothetical protein
MSGASDQKRGADLFLQLPDLSTQGWLRHVQLSGSSLKGPFFDDHCIVQHLFQFHDFPRIDLSHLKKYVNASVV